MLRRHPVSPMKYAQENEVVEEEFNLFPNVKVVIYKRGE